MIKVMDTRAVVDAMLDAGWLSDQLGTAVEPVHVRVKPETAVTVAFRELASCGDERCGWVRVLWPEGRAKAEKFAGKAARLGHTVVTRELASGLVFQSGPVAADPKLMRILGVLGGVEGGRILRYNPQRRVVMRVGGRVIRVTAEPNTMGKAMGLYLYRNVASELRVPERIDDGSNPHLVSVPYVGVADLSQRAEIGRCADLGRGVDTQLLHQHAGAMLGQLHGLVGPAEAVREQPSMDAHVRLLAVLAPGLAARAAFIGDRLPAVEGPVCLLHGDASPDQFLWGLRGELWMTDFDRARRGPAAVDLGSYLAEATVPEGEAMLRGYAAQRALPEESQLRAGRLASLAARVMTPLRKAEPNWRERVATRLDEIEGMLP